MESWFEWMLGMRSDRRFPVPVGLVGEVGVVGMIVIVAVISWVRTLCHQGMLSMLAFVYRAVFKRM